MKMSLHIIVLIIVGLAGACTEDKGEVNQLESVLIKVRSDNQFGKILTDIDGRALYFYANDSFGNGISIDSCSEMWKVFNVDLKIETISSELDINDFKIIIRADGRRQISYKGRPLYLYTFKQNGNFVHEQAGELSGEGKDNVWFVAKPDYTITLSNAQLVGYDGNNYTNNYKEGLGKTMYFTDAWGQTLYTYTYDSKNQNSFTLPDFSNNYLWPIYEEDQIVVPSLLDKKLFGSIYGKKQLTYKGWPLYFFSRDLKQMGSNKGVSFPMSGGIWPVPVKDMIDAPKKVDMGL